MSVRVLSTQEARQSISRLQAIITGGLVEQVTSLSNEGARLSDPNVWDGALAMQFRSELWPQTKATLDKTVAALEDLRTRIESINANIMAAGGNG